MSYAGEASDQVVRMTLEGTEVAVKLSGAAAKQIAVMLYAILKDSNKTKGKVRLSNMLKSGKELKVFAVQDQDLAQFCRAAKEYGVLYCVLKDRDANDGITDLMVRAEDASKINRIYERFNLATVDRAAIKTEIAKAIEDQEVSPEPEAESKSVDEQLVDRLLGNDGDQQKGEDGKHSTNPTQSRPEKPAPSRNISGATGTRTGDDKEVIGKRPSVKKELEEIKNSMQRSRESSPERSKGKSLGTAPKRSAPERTR